MEHPCSPPVPKADAINRDRVLRRSLANRSDYLLLGASVAAGLALAASVCVPERFPLPLQFDFGPHALPLALPLALLPMMLTLLLIGIVLTPWRYSLEKNWLKTLPFPFAHHGYLMVLKSQAKIDGLTLLLTFGHAPAQADFEQLAKLRLRGSKLRWIDDATVMVHSPAHLQSMGSFSRGVFSNAPLHRWFRRTAAPFLLDLHRKAGLKKVTVTS